MTFSGCERFGRVLQVMVNDSTGPAGRASDGRPAFLGYQTPEPACIEILLERVPKR